MKYFYFTILFILLLFSIGKSQNVAVNFDGLLVEPPKIGDCDCNGQIDISDCVFVINYIFAGGPKLDCPMKLVTGNYSYTAYDSSTQRESRKLIVTVYEDTLWKSVKFGCFNLNKTDNVRIFQKVQTLLVNNLPVQSDTTTHIDFVTENAKTGDNCYMMVER